MRARSWLLSLIAAVLLASLAGRLMVDAAHAAAATNHPVPAPKGSSAAVKFTPLMVFQPIGRRLVPRPQPSEPPLIASVYQAGKAFDERSDYRTNRFGQTEAIVFTARYKYGADYGLTAGETVSIDGSVQVKLLSYDYTIALPTDDGIYMLKAGTQKPCWFSTSFKPTQKSPILIYANDGRHVLVTITTKQFCSPKN